VFGAGVQVRGERGRLAWGLFSEDLLLGSVREADAAQIAAMATSKSQRVPRMG